MSQFAFKEWAVICQALAEGAQTLILRKGGIAEENGEFRPEHTRFWLFPTYLHQTAAGLNDTWAARLPEVERTRPPANIVRLTHMVEVEKISYAKELEQVLALEPFHVWSTATVRQRFAYRTPGLYVLWVRVTAASESREVPNLPEYDGCKTWVDLGK